MWGSYSDQRPKFLHQGRSPGFADNDVEDMQPPQPKWFLQETEAVIWFLTVKYFKYKIQHVSANQSALQNVWLILTIMSFKLIRASVVCTEKYSKPWLLIYMMEQ